MHIIESFSAGKKEDSLNEDGIFFSNHFAAVIDGSTSKIASRFGNLTKGQKATSLTQEALKSLPPTCTLSQALKVLTENIQKNSPTDFEKKEAAYRLTCSAVIFSKYRRELWFIGDCQARFNGKNHTHPKRVDDILAQIRSDIDHYLIQKGYTIDRIRNEGDPGRKFILKELREQCNFQNDPHAWNPFSYPVIDGMPIDINRIPVISVPSFVNEIILGSDGYPLLFDSLEETELYLHSIIQKDPLCLNQNKQTKGCMQQGKSYDDRTYLRIHI